MHVQVTCMDRNRDEILAPLKSVVKLLNGVNRARILSCISAKGKMFPLIVVWKNTPSASHSKLLSVQSSMKLGKGGGTKHAIKENEKII